MRYWINTVDGDPANAEWYDSLHEAEAAALESAKLSGDMIHIGTFNLGGPSYILKQVFA